MGKRQHPLPQRSLRQHLIGQQRRGLGHAPCAARGAESALLATERYELLGVTSLAANAQEALFHAAALQVRIELLLDVIRQRPTCFGSKLSKRRIMPLHQPPGLEGEALERHTLDWAGRGNASGAAYVTPAVLEGRWMVRVSVGSLTTEREHVAVLWELLRTQAAAG